VWWESITHLLSAPFLEYHVDGLAAITTPKMIMFLLEMFVWNPTKFQWAVIDPI